MRLNQIDTGKPCSGDVKALRDKLPEGSLMTYTKVYAWNLAKVLDRVEALETFVDNLHHSYQKMRREVV